MGPRETQTSPHSVAVAVNTPSTGPGMGNKPNWTLTGVVLPCLLSQLSASDDASIAQPVVLSQQQARTVWRVRFPSMPNLDGNLNRLKIVTPAAYAGRLLRITQPPVDTQLLGQSIQCVCEEMTQDKQTAPLMATPKLRKRKGAGRGE